MHLMLHIFKKDFRRLWWAVAGTTAILAALAHLDRWRLDWGPTQTEGWLAMLLPVAWCVLIGMVVQEEPLVGRRQFWITRPYRWPTLLGSKLLFIVVFMHVPLFLAHALILFGHGFRSSESLSSIFWIQFQVASLTITAIALATLFRNFLHYLLVLVLLAGAALYLNGQTAAQRPIWLPADSYRIALECIGRVVVAIAVILFQYARRRLVVAVSVGLLGTVVGTSVLSSIPPDFTTNLRLGLHRGQPRITVQASTPILETERPGPYAQLSIPVTISGVPNTRDTVAYLNDLDLVQTNGVRIPAHSYNLSAGASRMMSAELYGRVLIQSSMLGFFPTSHRLINLSLPRKLADQLPGQTVRLHGTATAALLDHGSPASIPINGAAVVPGLGRCFSQVGEDPNPLHPATYLKVWCDSLGQIPRAEVELRDTASSERWNQSLGVYAANPRNEDWLSPLNRRAAFFTCDIPDRLGRGSHWLIPPDVLTHATLIVTPILTKSWSIQTFDFPLTIPPAH